MIVAATRRRKESTIVTRIAKRPWLYIMLLPGVIYFLVFKYLPMWGLVISFQNYQSLRGVWGSKWVGFKHFEEFFTNPAFWMLFKNTALLAVYNILFFFPLPIILAILLNEVRFMVFKRFVQTVVYIPHFFSWVIVFSITYFLLATEGGVINEILKSLGFSQVNFLMSEHTFRPLITLQVIWKETGWGTIIFLAAIAGISPELYESAEMDGANRIQKIFNITLPSIVPTIVILLILRLGDFLDTGFEQIFLMLNPMNRNVGEVFDTYIYYYGIGNGQFSYSTAVGLFKSVLGMALVLMANRAARRLGHEGIF